MKTTPGLKHDVVAVVNVAASDFRNTDLIKVMDPSDDHRFARKVLGMTYRSILDESGVDFEYMSNDLFLELRDDFYVRGKTVHDYATERQSRINVMNTIVAWVAKKLAVHDVDRTPWPLDDESRENYLRRMHEIQKFETLLENRAEMKWKPGETLEEWTWRTFEFTAILIDVAWNNYKNEFKIVEEMFDYNCAWCGRGFKSEASRGKKMFHRDRVVRFCREACRYKFSVSDFFVAVKMCIPLPDKLLLKIVGVV
jgi:hypothetical protein